MIKVLVGNSTCQIEGLDRDLHLELREVLSYTLDSGYYTGSPGPRRISLLSRRDEFPTGLLYLVKQHFESKGIFYTIFDRRIAPRHQDGLFKASLGVTPYPEQIAASRACKRVEHRVLNGGGERGIIVAPTGLGKSMIVALIIERLQVPTLVVVPSLNLKHQLSKSLGEIFGIDKVGAGKPIRVENVDALSKKIDYKYDCVIIDEFHHSGAKTYQNLNKKAWHDVYYKYGLTATPFRSQDNERLLLESVLSEVIYRVDYSHAVNKGYILPMEAYYYELPKTKTKISGTWKKVYSELVVNNEARNKLIADLMVSLHQSKVSTLCLVKEIKHGESISALCGAAFANGMSDESPWLIQQFNTAKLTTLIGTTGVIGEGVDTRPAEFVIIAGLGKSKNALMQQFGRGFRVYPGKTSCKIILFYDPNHKWTRDHFKTQCKILKEEYGIIPIKLD